MKKVASLLIIGLSSLAVDAMASPEMDLAISSSMAALEVSQLQEGRGSLWSLGATRNGEIDATSASLTYNLVGDLAAAQNIRTGLGWKAVYHNTFQSGISIAVGGGFRYESVKLTGVGLEGRVYLAPQALNTNDSVRYQEAMMRITYNLHNRAKLFGGWMDKTVKYNDAAPVREVEISHTLNIGFTLDF